MHMQDITPADIERHMRHAHEIRSQSLLRALARIPAAMRRAGHGVVALFV